MTTTAGEPTTSEDLLAAGGIRLESAGALATVVLDRAERRNAMSPSMWLALGAVPDHLPPQTRVVIIRGAGETFCSGIDLRMATPEGVPGEGSLASIVAEHDDAALADRIGVWQRGLLWMRDPRWITISAVQGAAVGGGFQLALAADLCVAAADARFCMRENALGLVPDLTGTKALCDRVGYARTLEICATARWVPAEEAAALGIVHSVVAVDELSAAVSALAEALLATQPAPAVALKQLLLDLPGRSVAEQARAERTAQVPLIRAMTAQLGDSATKAR